MLDLYVSVCQNDKNGKPTNRVSEMTINFCHKKLVELTPVSPKGVKISTYHELVLHGVAMRYQHMKMHKPNRGNNTMRMQINEVQKLLNVVKNSNEWEINLGFVDLVKEWNSDPEISMATLKSFVQYCLNRQTEKLELV